MKEYALMDHPSINRSKNRMTLNRTKTTFQVFLLHIHPLDQWFSTRVPRNPCVLTKALGVPPVYGRDVYLLAN